MPMHYDAVIPAPAFGVNFIKSVASRSGNGITIDRSSFRDEGGSVIRAPLFYLQSDNMSEQSALQM